MASSKGRCPSLHTITLHQRLYHALNLGFRIGKDKEKKWNCTDIEIQRHVVRSIAAFLDCFSRDSANSLLKDSISDIARALDCILGCRNRTVAGMAADAVAKLVHITSTSSMQLYTLDLVESLSLLLCCQQVEAVLPCAIALNSILLRIRDLREKEVWRILEERKVVVCITGQLQDISGSTMHVECFHEMASLLSTILLRWPLSRYYVWNDSALMVALESISRKPDMGLRVAVLKLYSAVALCGHGAKKLLENGMPMLDVMVSCMEKSSPQNARVEGFKLAQRLSTGKEECLTMIGMCSEALVKAIVWGMSQWSLTSGKLPSDQMSLLLEACKLALITRWEGKHHICFWKYGITRVLFRLVVENSQSQSLHASMSVEEQISIAEKVLNANFLPTLRSYVWDIIGFLGIHCEEEFNPASLGEELHLNFLVTCACLTFSRSIQKGYQICQTDMISASQSESGSRAVLMMINSPCRYLASKARAMLSFILERDSGEHHLRSLMNFLSYTASGKSFILPNILQTAVCLVGLTCYSCIPQYASLVIKNKGIETLLSFSRWYLKKRDQIGPSSFAPHLQSIVEKRTCCWDCTADWDNRDTLLLYSLWALAELLYHSSSQQIHLEEFSTERDSVRDELCATLEEVRDSTYCSGPRWYSAHILGYFGYYGFQSKFGRRVMRALEDEVCSDMQLVFGSGMNMSVHRVILAVMCPLLLPPEDRAQSCSTRCDTSVGSPKEIRMSASVDSEALIKLLEFVYSGYVQVETILSKKLKTLARHCNSQILLQMLCRRRPKWGSSIPTIDLRPALSSTYFSDVILESKERDVGGWKCSFCSSALPHVHAHRVVLWSSCEYLRALFQSGMQESKSERLGVPVGWLALQKLMNWFYTDELPKPPSGCIWTHNINTDQKLDELRSYVELYSLAEFWIIQDLQDECGRVIDTCLESAKELSVRTIQIAAELSQWKLAEAAAANHAAPIYHKLRDLGELDELDEPLLNMIRTASVSFSRIN